MTPSAAATSIAPQLTGLSKTSIFADIGALKLSLEDAGLSGATEILTRVPVRKPQKQEFFRVRGGEENCLTTFVFEDKETREFYFVAPDMVSPLREVGDVSVVTLVQFMTRQKVLGILRLKIPTDASVSSGWQETAMVAAERAKTNWSRMQADMALGGYRVFEAKGQFAEPEWPTTPFSELLDIAFRDRVIDTPDHPVFNKLLGLT